MEIPPERPESPREALQRRREKGMARAEARTDIGAFLSEQISQGDRDKHYKGALIVTPYTWTTTYARDIPWLELGARVVEWLEREEIGR